MSLAQLEQQIKAAESTLARLNGQIEAGKKLAAEVDQVHQHIRAKRTELAQLEMTIAQKSELHGKVDADLRDLRKRVSGDFSHA